MVTVFFDTLGIGSFAPTTSLFKATNQVENELIPGTLNVATSIPVFIMAFIFISSIKVEAITLFSMIFSAMIGSMFAASMFKRFSKDVVKLILGIALLFTSILMTLGQFDIIDSLGVGNEIGLKGNKLTSIGVTIDGDINKFSIVIGIFMSVYAQLLDIASIGLTFLQKTGKLISSISSKCIEVGMTFLINLKFE